MLGGMDSLRGQLVNEKINYHDLFQWTISERHPLILASGVSVAVALVLFLQISHSRQPSKSTPSPTAREKKTLKPPDRPLGVWTPVDFKRPVAPPYPDWDVKTTKPLPYRPFKWGPYHITMGLRTMKWDEWIELDNHYMKFHDTKARRIEERGPKCCRTAPDAFDGACELLEEL